MKKRISDLNKYVTDENLKKINTILLNYYNLVPKSVERVRSAYKVNTDKYTYCLKEFKHNDKKASIGYHLTIFLKDNGFDGVADYIKTVNGADVIKYNKRYYYLTSWIEGLECDFKDINILKQACAFLADFHNKSKGFHVNSIKIKSNYNNWEKKVLDIKKDLLKFKSIIANKILKTYFDEEYNKLIDFNLTLCDKALQIFNNDSYKNLCKRAKIEKLICHDSFYYQNLLINDKGKMFLIDLDSVIYDLPVYDLAKFIRRIMNKSYIEWDFDIAKDLISAYEEVRKIEKDEFEVFLGHLIIPHRFWKLGKKRYLKRKEWSEEKYLKKLKKEIELKDKREEFISKFIENYLQK
ncbi:MAG: CotS family spore coat protein [Caloramator sp.]|nr:CotS family spore coat protein [Caloramator sp.]